MTETRKIGYAAKTEVPVERSRLNIEKMLTKFGATGFGSAWQEGREMLFFACRGLHIRFTFEPIDPSEYERRSNGNPRGKASTEAAVAQAHRTRWRELELLLKAKLVAIECGIRTFEEEFLPDVVMANQQRASEWMLPQLQLTAFAQKMPPMLPGYKEE